MPVGCLCGKLWERKAVVRVFVSEYASPIGPLWLCSDGEALTGLHFAHQEGERGDKLPLHKEAARQLREYFAGERTEFSLPLKPQGTPFQLAVWRALTEIPYGETRSYGAIAAAVGNPKASRAVGMANNRNPISIIVPCHRVIGSTGKLVGYGGGLDKKIALLELERKHHDNG